LIACLFVVEPEAQSSKNDGDSILSVCKEAGGTIQFLALCL
jgi:hypothetical protein|tara:strand:+ start:773 stop:895 length:123 start_codon:yes stop_codon:yes gene_type:complete